MQIPEYLPAGSHGDASFRTRVGRERILSKIRAAAITEFSLHGIKGASTQAIADRAGLTKPQLHYYISSKQELYEGLLNAVLTGWAETFNFDEASDDPRAVLTHYVRRKLDYALDNPGLSRIFTSELLSGGPHLESYWPVADRTINEKVSIIERWVAQGRVRPLNARILLMQIWAITQHYADYAVQVRKVLQLAPGAQVDRESIARELTNFVLHGCGISPE